jgi:hypothetical protein
MLPPGICPFDEVHVCSSTPCSPTNALNVGDGVDAFIEDGAINIKFNHNQFPAVRNSLQRHYVYVREGDHTFEATVDVTIYDCST